MVPSDELEKSPAWFLSETIDQLLPKTLTGTARREAEMKMWEELVVANPELAAAIEAEIAKSVCDGDALYRTDSKFRARVDRLTDWAVKRFGNVPAKKD